MRLSVLRGLPLRQQFLLFILIIVVVVCGGILVFYAQVARLTVEQNTEYVRTVFEQVQVRVEQSAVTVGRLLRTVAYNPGVQQYLQATDPLELFGIQTQVRPFLTQILAFTDGLIDIALRPIAGPPLSLGSANSFIDASGREYGGANRPVYSELVQYGSITETVRQPALIVGISAHSILPDETYGVLLGDVVMVVAAGLLVPARGVSAGAEVTTFYVLDRAGAVITGMGAVPVLLDLSGVPLAADLKPRTLQIGDELYLVQSAPIGTLGGTVVGVTARRLLLRDARVLRSIMLMVLLGVILALGVPAAFLLRNISMPIARLTSFVSRAKGRDLREFTERVTAEGFREVRTLTSEFNGMLDEVSRLTGQLLDANARAYRAEILERETELAALQSQINPHFLYNTLETMRGMALAEQAPRVAEVTEALGRICKYAVKAGDLVELRTELHVLDSYIRIQKARFADRVVLQTEVDPQSLGVDVPKMILQPIVENAVVHGLEQTRSGGVVRLAAAVDPPDTLTITISDNGLGMSEDRLHEVRAELGRDHHGGGHGGGRSIGLRNIQDRLALTYGPGATLAISSSDERGTVVTLRLPLRRSGYVPDTDR